MSAAHENHVYALCRRSLIICARFYLYLPRDEEEEEEDGDACKRKSRRGCETFAGGELFVAELRPAERALHS